jgi:alanyl-tRNA synthetase
VEFFAVVDRSPFYAEMGGQVGDAGELLSVGETFRVINTVKRGGAFFLKLDHPLRLAKNDPRSQVAATLHVDPRRRRAIERHHTGTHLLHWAIHEVVSRDATQKGSFVGPEKLTFDFNSSPLTPEQLRDVERLVNERVVENSGVFWTEVPHAEIKSRSDVMQFFGDKYGDIVRVVQIGGQPRALDGYSMELCAGTHTRATGEIGLFRIISEGAIAAGVRRIEAVAGLQAYEIAQGDAERLKQLAARLGAPLSEFERKLETLLAQHKELENQLETARGKRAADLATKLVEKKIIHNGTPAIIEQIDGANGDELQAIADALKNQFEGVVFLAGTAANSVSLLVTVSPKYAAKWNAGKIIQTIAPIVGGKGGGRAEAARGAGKDVGKVAEALARAVTVFD